MLNLARKWRSKHFDEVVGQPLVVRLVKNSLYRNFMFPVYLLSGTRGCGKTSVARIFAAALNCHKLEEFQKNPQLQIPCLECASCKAMQATHHPDFIELDAASHTGVDNVREIIEAASCVPIMGTRKIYLIDEAHMLSKAAFNALLKILEEPPPSVVFMLATTDPHKILETVTSRCFQLYFDPIKRDAMVQQLSYICAQEGIEVEPAAFDVIAQETEGSLRDALNLLERLRIAYAPITKQSVIELLGSIDDDALCEIFELVVKGSPQELLTACARLDLPAYNASVVWKKFVEYIRLALWLKNGVAPQDAQAQERIKAVAKSSSYERLIKMFEIAYEYELLFSKTTLPGAMLEMMLLKMAQAGNQGDAGSTTMSAGGSAAQRSHAAGASSSASIKSAPVTHKVASTAVRESHPIMNSVKLKPADENVPVAVPTENNVLKKALQAESVKRDAQPEIKEAVDSIAKEVPPIAVESKRQANPAEQPAQESANDSSSDSQWQQCIREIEKVQDPLVISLFKQGTGEKFDSQTGRLEIIFSQDLSFFKDWLENTKNTWEPYVCEIYGKGTILIPHFVGPSTKERPLKPAHFTASGSSGINDAMNRAQAGGSNSRSATDQKAAPSSANGSKPLIRRDQKKAPEPRQKVVEVNQDMPLAQMVTQAFPGTVVTQEGT